jgi:hypothetical protein
MKKLTDATEKSDSLEDDVSEVSWDDEVDSGGRAMDKLASAGSALTEEALSEVDLTVSRTTILKRQMVFRISVLPR